MRQTLHFCKKLDFQLKAIPKQSLPSRMSVMFLILVVKEQRYVTELFLEMYRDSRSSWRLREFLKTAPYTWLPHHDLFMEVSAQVGLLSPNLRAAAWGTFTTWKTLVAGRTEEAGDALPLRCSPTPWGSAQLAVLCHWFSFYATLCALRHFHNDIENAWSSATNKGLKGFMREIC